MVTGLALPFIRSVLSSKEMWIDPEHREQRWRSVTQVLPGSRQKCSMGQKEQF